jgi:hypothetical protein
MIVFLYFLCGIAGLALGAFICGIWVGASLLFGFPTPTPDQLQGLVILSGSIGVVGSVAFSALAAFFSCWT